MMLLLLALACGGDKGADDSATPGFTWTGGDFDFQTLAVDDACLGGALELMFMPEGPDAPHDFAYPIHVPAWEDLPETYDVDFREPFVGMPVTVADGGDGTLQLRGSVMEAVAMGATWGDCVVTMSVDADLVPTDADILVGEARIAISDPRGSQERCPVFDDDPCTVTLDLAASRR